MAKYKRNNQTVDKVRIAGLHAILAGAVVLERAYKLALSTPGGGGGSVWEPRNGQRYRPSTPGDAPTVQTGTLRRSIGIDVGDLKTRGTVKVGSNVEYAKPLEFGTRHMAARPWMRPVNRSKATRGKIDRAQIRELRRRMAKI